MPRGRAFRLGPINAQRRSEGLWIGRADTHPVYGAGYEVAPLARGLTPEQLQEYVDREGWYHQIDLGDGVVTRGMKQLADIDREWNLFDLGSLGGKRVLDIGGIDGAYAFRAEQAGARDVAVLDHYLWATDSTRYTQIYEEERAAGRVPPAPHESDAWHPDTTPTRWRFDAARQALGSDVRAVPLDFAGCDLGIVGVWDVVLYLGVLYHMPDPVGMLRRLAAVTREQAIIETEAMFIRGHPEPLSRFFPGGELNDDRSNWWAPNMGALLGMLGDAGFADTEILAGEPTDSREGDGPHHYRAIVRAIK